MASRFEDVNDEGLLHLIENRDSVNTKNIIKGAVRILGAYCESKDLQLSEFEMTADKQELNTKLKKFYAELRTQKRTLYSKKSMLSIRYGLQKHFLKLQEIDIVNDKSFMPANKIFEAMLTKIKQEGKGASLNKQPLSEQDLQLLYNSFDLDSPYGLQNKVFCDYMLYFCSRGRENLRDLKKTDFLFCGEGDNKYIKLRDNATKNHKGDIKDAGESQGGRLYPVPDSERCPVKSLIKYLSLLNDTCDWFWQRPHLMVKSENDPWYMNSPLGKNILGNKMKQLSLTIPLSRTYTNHCLRATSVTIMDRHGFEARHIMAVSGHKSEASIRNYARTDDDKKRQMAQTIATVIDPTAGNDDHQLAPVTMVALPAAGIQSFKVSNPVTREMLALPDPKGCHIMAKHGPASNQVSLPMDTRTSQILPYPDYASTQNTGNIHNFADIDTDDFLELTDSQEKYVLQEITNQNTFSSVEQRKSTHTTKRMMGRQLHFHGAIHNVHIHYH